MPAVDPVLFVGLGGTAGALARHLVGERIERGTRDTLLVNVVGSFLLGLLTALAVPEVALLALGTGFCGAFTTFSTFAFETTRLVEERDLRGAALNAGLNLGGGLAAVALGALLAGLL
ncbi:fluoride efflux transporter CrcB [Salinirubellus salinus]|jgi:CrcB protein|uniref:Fluoride-specific ion channel FluC n=1 Tax=Salinirubellus salinus TaxID=1364945 RepID=A0A9E7R2C1_9EURY|nr:fluoride efflux transporter CrcB [Salinirubellus salinus]UWM54193.1 fluoride efflux transporter CrcB [Salinirubellus salinus]